MSDFSESNVSNGDLPIMEFHDGIGPTYDPVCELMRAIILRAIEDYSSDNEHRQEAIDYFFSDEDEYVFSFVAICRHIGFDPGKTREAIMQATRRISTRRRAA